MRKRRVWLGLPGILMTWLVGCAIVDPRPDYDRVQQHVNDATGVAVLEPPQDAAAAEALTSERLSGGLTADEALQICLMNNPRVRAAYLRVGVARADVVQAGLFQNPGLSLSLRLPDGGGLSNVELGVAQNIADFWLIPARKRAAEGQLQHETLAVAREVSAAALDTRAAYLGAVAADRELEIANENRGVAQQLLDAALARQAAGVGSEIDVNLARTEFMQTEVGLRTSKLAAFDALRRLAVLLGLKSPPDELVLVDKLPDPSNLPLTDEQLLRVAERSRLDLVAAGYVVQAAAARVEQEKHSVISNVELGISFEQEQRGRRGDRPWLSDTIWASAQAAQLTPPSLQPREKLPTDTVLGPTLSLELPIFDQNQAQVARAEYLHRSAVASQDALLLEVMQETRAAAARARAAGDIAAYYRDSLLPLAQTNLDLSREAYRTGKLPLHAVLQAQKALLAARSNYIEALREGAISRAELEKSVGLPIDRLIREAAAPASTPTLPRAGTEVQP